MLTHRRHRYITRWPRRLAFALAIVLLLAAAWCGWRTWEAATRPHEPAGQLASLSTSPTTP
ncbi:hypothetical protein [Hymenobacter arcticus]